MTNDRTDQVAKLFLPTTTPTLKWQKSSTGWLGTSNTSQMPMLLMTPPVKTKFPTAKDTSES